MLKAIRKQVHFASSVAIDAYLVLETNEFRVGMTGASTSLGYGEKWFSNVSLRRGDTLKALTAMGLSGSSLEVTISNHRGSTIAKTISLADYNVLIDYAMEDGKKQAIALNRALRQNDLNNRLCREFGVAQKPGWQQDLEMAQIIELMLDAKEELKMQFLPGDIDVYGANACADIFYLN
jgi:hypothetical protein